MFIGRFQPFHIGHLWAVQKIARECQRVVIGIGSSQYAREHVNPFSAAERRDQISQALSEAGLDSYAIFEIADIHDDARWVQHVRSVVPHFDTVYTGSELTRELFLKEGCKVVILPRHMGISGSEIRLRIATGKRWQHMVPNSVCRLLDKMGADRIILSSKAFP